MRRFDAGARDRALSRARRLRWVAAFIAAGASVAGTALARATLPRHKRKAIARARRAVEHTLTSIDRSCTRFDPGSELARVNAMSGHRLRVSATLGQALTLALQAAAATRGAVDPTVGGSLEAAGYDRDFASV